jgi:hypothetical protein
MLSRQRKARLPISRVRSCALQCTFQQCAENGSRLIVTSKQAARNVNQSMRSQARARGRYRRWNRMGARGSRATRARSGPVWRNERSNSCTFLPNSRRHRGAKQRPLCRFGSASSAVTQRCCGSAWQQQTCFSSCCSHRTPYGYKMPVYSTCIASHGVARDGMARHARE